MINRKVESKMDHETEHLHTLSSASIGSFIGSWIERCFQLCNCSRECAPCVPRSGDTIQLLSFDLFHI